MRVARLEIFGFKSFMDRLVLPLDGGITGVVGPNGCGKSNIVDALRWVLGETRASQLRGGVLEDVIFNGTDLLRPLGLAEVTITLRSTTKDILSEIAARSGEETSLEKTAGPFSNKGETDEDASSAGVAQKNHTTDTTENGTARPQLTVIEGRKRDDDTLTEDLPEGVVSNDFQLVEDEDGAPGEAAPHAELVLNEVESPASSSPPALQAPHDHGPSLLSRFSWLRSISEVQITRRLYRSGESEFFINRVPCRLKDLKDLFRAVHLGARAYTIVAQGEVSRIITAKPEERRLIIEEAAGIAGFRDRIAEARRRLDDTRAGVSRIDDVVKELARQVASLKRQAQRALARNELKEELSTLEKLLFSHSLVEISINERTVTEKHQGAVAREQESEQLLKKASEEEHQLRTGMVGIDSEADGVRRAIDKIRDELSKHARRVSEHRSKLSEVRALAQSRRNEVLRMSERRRTLEERSRESGSEVQALEQQERDLAEKLLQIDLNSEEELKKISERLQALRNDMREKEKSLREARDKFISHRSRLQAIQEQIVAASPLNQLSRSLGSKTLQTLQISETPLFAEALKVPEQYVRAVQAVLAEKAQFLLSPAAHEIGGRFAEQLQLASARDKKGLGLGVFRAGSLKTAVTKAVPFPPILEVIEIEERASLVAHHLFQNVYFVERLEDALAFFATDEVSLDQEVTLVTSEGDIVTPYSFFSFRHEGGLIHLKTKETELEALVATYDADHQTRAKEREEHAAAITDAERRHAEVLRESQRKQTLMRELGREQGNVRGRLQAAKRLVEQVTHDIQRIGVELQHDEVKAAELAAREAALEEEVKKLESESTEGLEKELGIQRATLDGIEQRRRQGRSALEQVARSVSEKRRALDYIRRELSESTLVHQRAGLARESLIERMKSEYGQELLDQLLAQHQGAVTERGESNVVLPGDEARTKRERLLEVKKRIHREGEVDPASVELFEVENRRLEELLAQKKDLEDAAKVIGDSVAQLTRGAEVRFQSTFDAVKDKFQALIPRVFGGGHGELVLTDTANPLDAGVAITVRPPGKAPKSIDLLSGGEKALSATALIMALFSQAPSPLCVLDEVDAPLDEANLLRFLGLLKEMSKMTQFIMITHNKQSMIMADRLVGVTQEQPGSSKAISVSLQEAQDVVDEVA